MSAPGLLQLSWRPYRFVLPRRLITSGGALVERSGWLLRLHAPNGELGWGEGAAPLLTPAPPELAAAVAALPTTLARQELEQHILQLPAPLACAVGSAGAAPALVDADSGAGDWRATLRLCHTAILR
jgi:O-succinylbenzoate synthase